MPKLRKKISEIIILPETWVSTWNPKGSNGKPIYETMPVYEIGPGEVKVFSLSEEEKSEIKNQCAKMTVIDGQCFPTVDQKMSIELQFSARLGGDRGYWKGFYGPDEPDGTPGPELNCTKENQRRFAHDDGLWTFVCQHVGPILDKIAEGKAEEEEKNSLLSLAGKPVGENGLAKRASSAKKQ